jgi:colanic acid biosynthesis glycosyl transferase WcaI
MNGTSARIVVHDYSGHPGQAQLSRALAERGYRVTHQHCPSYATGKGALTSRQGDPPTLNFEPCPMKGEFRRYSVSRRVRQEVSYGWMAGRLITADEPDVAIISNVPLLAHALMTWRVSRKRIPMIFWHQDIYSAAIGAQARKKFPIVGRLISWMAEQVERTIARSSAAIVAISPIFLEKLSSWGVAEKTTVVPNWASIEEVPVLARRNPWSDRMGLSSAPVVLYSGTLGLKHDPSILAMVAEELSTSCPEARVVVVSEGKGRDWLEAWKLDQGASNLVLLDFQSYDDLPSVLATADLLVAVLEPDASKFSVPSKVLTYLCAERAILGVIPLDNSVAEILLSNHAGVVIDPADRQSIAAAVIELLRDDDYRRDLGHAGRHYAEIEFSPKRAADQFEAIFRDVIRARPMSEISGLDNP